MQPGSGLIIYLQFNFSKRIYHALDKRNLSQYCSSGTDGSSALATHEIYDPAAGTWSSAPSLPTARTHLAAVTGRDGLIYAIVGYNGPDPGGVYLTTVE